MSLQFQQPFEPQTSGVRGRQVTAHDPINDNWVVRRAGGGDTLFVDNISLPGEVGAGGIIDVTVEVVNAALSIGPSDPDSCSEGVDSGYEYRVTVNGDWPGAAESRENCLEVGVPLNPSRETHQLPLDAPTTPGEYTINVTVEGVGSGFSSTGSFPLLVPEQGGDQRPGGDPVDGDEPINGGDGGGGFLDEILGGGGGLALGFTGGLLFLVVLLVLLIAIGGE